MPVSAPRSYAAPRLLRAAATRHAEKPIGADSQDPAGRADPLKRELLGRQLVTALHSKEVVFGNTKLLSELLSGALGCLTSSSEPLACTLRIDHGKRISPKVIVGQVQFCRVRGTAHPIAFGQNHQ